MARRPNQLRWLLIVLLPLGLAVVWAFLNQRRPVEANTPATSQRAYFPLIFRQKPSPTATPTRTRTPTRTLTPSSTPLPSLTPTATPYVCQRVPGQEYALLSINGSPSDRPAEQHADLNLALRGYVLNSGAFKGIVDYDGMIEPGALQLDGLFADRRTPIFSNVYRVYDWNWSCNCRGNPITTWPVTLAGLAVTPGEIIRAPDRPEGEIDVSGRKVLVLYASTSRITLKYTREDNVIAGYTLHIENLCVEPSLLALYQAANAAGRWNLPALYGLQVVGRARGYELGVAIRDTGSFMDPRVRKDWWKGH